MGIPYWLLRLLPMWKYICPKCRKDVKQNTHQCPYCGERFPLAIKVPSRLLKDPKKLETYVHKRIFPRIGEFEHNYLAKYFTTIFSDGFESGDFSAWTVVVGSSSVQSVTKHHGTYAMLADTSNDEILRKDFSAVGTTFVRAYFYFDSQPTSGKKMMLISLYGPSPLHQATFGIKNDAGVLKWGTTYRYPPNTEGTYAETPNPEPGQWYCVEMKLDPNNEIRLYVDGVSVLSESFIVGGSGPTILFVGSFGKNETLIVYVDCVIISDAYIGPEGGGATLQTVTDSLALSDSALRHKALLMISDSAALTEVFSRGKAFAIIDSLNLADTERAQKELLVLDSSSLADAASTVSRILKVTESVSVAEVVQVGAGGGTRKTRLFLILGDLALQLTGD